MLEDNIRALRRDKDLLLMPHLVLGHPSLEDNARLIDTMVEAGAEIIEMQIPFSEPMADGPVILKANEASLKNGTNTTQCLAFAEQICAKHKDTIFIFMSYYNVLFAYGLDRFLDKAKAAGIQGLIVPDLPPEEGAEYLAACAKRDLSPILLFTPTNTDERLKTLSIYGKGLAYCVGRKGVTGIKTEMTASLVDLIRKYKRATTLPIALGFGIQSKADIEAIGTEIDIAIIGTQILAIREQEGIEAVGRFIKSLRA